MLCADSKRHIIVFLRHCLHQFLCFLACKVGLRSKKREHLFQKTGAPPLGTLKLDTSQPFIQRVICEFDFFLKRTYFISRFAMRKQGGRSLLVLIDTACNIEIFLS